MELPDLDDDFEPSFPELKPEVPSVSSSTRAFLASMTVNSVQMVAIRQTQQWIEVLAEAVNAKVTEMLDANHMLTPTIETLAIHESRIAAELFEYSLNWARLNRLKDVAEAELSAAKRCQKTDIDTAEGEATRDIMHDYEVLGRSLPAAKSMDRLVAAHPLVVTAVRDTEKRISQAVDELARVSEYAEGTKGMLTAIKAKLTIMPGMAGMRNASYKS